MASKNSRRPSFPGEKSFIVGRRKKYSSIDATSDEGTKPPVQPDGGPTVDPPVLPTMPSFPDFNTLTCQELDAAIRSYKAFLTTPSFAPYHPDVIQAYNDAIQKATIVYNAKGCATGGGGGQTPPVIIVPTSVTDNAAAAINTVPGASGGMMGGGGGGGSETKPSAAKKKAFPWLWVLGAGAVLYFLFSGGKKDSAS